jgi:FAD/FMN-containing dehydrogenase
VPADATAFAHRDSRIMVNVAAMAERAEQLPEHEPWVVGLSTELSADGAGAYAGFLGDEGEARVRAAYPAATWDRLAAVKAQYDPDNLFRLNQNIPPAAA